MSGKECQVYEIIDSIYCRDIQSLKYIDLVINATSVGFDSKFRINHNYYNLIKRSPLGRIGNKNEYATNKIKNDSFLLKLNESNLYDTVNFFVKNPKVMFRPVEYQDDH